MILSRLSIWIVAESEIRIGWVGGSLAVIYICVLP